ncbi:hypothetical protein [Streptomyces hydrogenans]|uniref:hypothetical protein n=1 Tax=Streptomyces hydrogenans TaxID=1873719 RepID=UPI0034183F29
MHAFRRNKSASGQTVKARQRGWISLFVVAAAFVLGAWLPQERVLGGAAVAALAVALTQLFLYIADSRSAALRGRLRSTSGEVMEDRE